MLYNSINIRWCFRRNLVEFKALAYRVLLYKFKFIVKMPTGKIARIMDRGYGFISREGDEKDLFFHSNDLEGVQFDELREGDEVTYEVAEGNKGPAAVNVSRV